MGVSIIQQLYVFVVRLLLFLDLLPMTASITRKCVLLLFLVVLHRLYLLLAELFIAESLVVSGSTWT